MSELDDTIEGSGAGISPAGVPTANAGIEPDAVADVDDAGGEVARRMRAVLDHGLAGGAQA